jgi:S-adenosylmethionine:tRNA ribosyltransferase-isomerase
LGFSEPLTPERLLTIGSVPLPPYIRRISPTGHDAERYQTIYGERFGSVAAPTAGLHFTNDLFERLLQKGIEKSYVTLHVGTGTFLPIRVQDIRHHQMHTEVFEVPKETANRFNALPPSARRLAVGTTSLRVLESISDDDGRIGPISGSTNLFVCPGYHFRAVTSLLTNFHTPGSSLLVLVSAFMGYELMREAYRKAVERRFRLFSYGDAMLIL